MLTDIHRNQPSYTGYFKRNNVLSAGFQFAKEITFKNEYLKSNELVNAVKHLQKKTPKTDVFEVVQDFSKMESGDVPVVLKRNGKSVSQASGNSVGENCYNAIRNYVLNKLKKDVASPAPVNLPKKIEVEARLAQLLKEKEEIEQSLRIEVCNKLDNLEGKIR